ncbi:MAG: ATP-binding protein, partial [Desulfobacterales bacterium]|nr:ATP-binding protein [Desulfobacterales bacterium]
ETGEATVGQRAAIKNQKGREIPIMASSALLKDSLGKVLGGFEIIRDLTAEVKAEKRLKHAYIREGKAKLAAEAAARAKSDFLANMSHEIRTPMNGVIAATDLAMGEDSPPKVKHYLGIIQSSAYSLLEIINDILDFSKIEADKLNIETHPFLLDEVMNRVNDMFMSKAVKKGIELLVDIDLEAPNALVGDSVRLQQVIKNLVDNSIKFTKKGGSILVGVKTLEKTSDRATLEFFIKDTGVGITPEYVDKLFKPFTQADTSSTRKHTGTGLGLSICKRLVELMGGRIWFESESGKGSTFSFTVRLGRQSADQKRKFVVPGKTVVQEEAMDTQVIATEVLQTKVMPLLKQLAGALELADPEEINISFKAVKEHLDFSTIQELENQLNDYDYGKALKSLEEIAAKIGGRLN